MRHGFHPEARGELVESVAYYDSQQPGLGERFLGSVTDAIRCIQMHPSMYPLIDGEWRQCRVPRFPFGLIYRVTSRQIEIVAVMHLHRMPCPLQTSLLLDCHDNNLVGLEVCFSIPLSVHELWLMEVPFRYDPETPHPRSSLANNLYGVPRAWPAADWAGPKNTLKWHPRIATISWSCNL